MRSRPETESASRRFLALAAAALLLVLRAAAEALPETCVTAASSSAARSPVEVVVELKTSYYDVKVTDSLRVAEAMHRARPWDEDTPFDAMTHWTVDWTYHASRDGDRFRVNSGKVTVSILITMPRLVFPKIMPRVQEVQTWRTCMRDLYEHEEGHARIATEAGEAVRKEMLALGSYPTPEELDAAVTAVSNRVIDDSLEKEREFDRLTSHGRHKR